MEYGPNLTTLLEFTKDAQPHRGDVLIPDPQVCDGLNSTSWNEPSNQSSLKETSPEYSLDGLMLKLKLQYLTILQWKQKKLYALVYRCGKTNLRYEYLIKTKNNTKAYPCIYDNSIQHLLLGPFTTMPNVVIITENTKWKTCWHFQGEYYWSG